MALQIVAYILSVTGLCGLIIGTFTNEWKILGHDNDKTVSQEKYEGLWMQCSVDRSAVAVCTNYNSLLHQTCEYLSSALWIHLSSDFCSNRCCVSLQMKSSWAEQ